MAPRTHHDGDVQNAFADDSNSLLMRLIQGNIVDYLMPPLIHPGELILLGLAARRDQSGLSVDRGMAGDGVPACTYGHAAIPVCLLRLMDR